MSNAERPMQNEEVEIRESYESPSMTNKVSFLGSRLLFLEASRFLVLASRF